MPFFWLAIVAAVMPATSFRTMTLPAALSTRMPSPVSVNGEPGLATSSTLPPVVFCTRRMLSWVLVIVPSVKVIVGSPPLTTTAPLVIVQS